MRTVTMQPGAGANQRWPPVVAMLRAQLVQKFSRPMLDGETEGETVRLAVMVLDRVTAAVAEREPEVLGESEREAPKLTLGELLGETEGETVGEPLGRTHETSVMAPRAPGWPAAPPGALGSTSKRIKKGQLVLM